MARNFWPATAFATVGFDQKRLSLGVELVFFDSAFGKPAWRNWHRAGLKIQ